LNKIAFVGTYPPRRCGIGTFTKNLVDSVVRAKVNGRLKDLNASVVALSDQGDRYEYPPEVSFEIRSPHSADYRRAAEFLNLSDVDAVSIQHEFGIFGGDDGEYLLQLMENLKKPSITTLHTILSNPTSSQLQIIKEICRLSTFVVVQSEKGKEFLTSIYGVPPFKIKLIYHGAPDVPFLDPVIYKDRFHAINKWVILTFGLLAPNKGIEIALKSLSGVIKKFPEVLYVVLGTTHPVIKKQFGEEYRLFLQKMVHNLGLEKNVVFHNYFVTEEELIQFIVAADIYLTPYLSQEQIVSGTLTYAIACGKAIISTPYYYASEMLGEERGCLSPFGDSETMSSLLIRLLDDSEQRNRFRTGCYRFGRRFVWPKIGAAYYQLFKKAVEKYKSLPAFYSIPTLQKEQGLPEVKLDYLFSITDDTGLFQHASYTIPDRRHGYTTDDNARGIVVLERNWALFKDEKVIPFLNIYLSFLRYAFNDKTGYFRNFMAYDRHFQEESGSEDSHSRALWALGCLIRRPPNQSVLTFATNLFQSASLVVEKFTSPRAWAYIIIGFNRYLERFGGDVRIKNATKNIMELLVTHYKNNESPDWPWLENEVTYDNARIAQAVIMAGRRFNKTEVLEKGLRSLEWLFSIQTDPSGRHLSLIGNNGWLKRGGEKAKFDQQPIEITALIDACYEAYLATKEKRWFEKAQLAFKWFLGSNDLNVVLYDSKTGGCKDGLTPTGVNENEGAESSLAFLLSLECLYQFNNLLEAEKTISSRAPQ